MSPEIRVHHFNVDPVFPSQTSLLETARCLVDAATSSTSPWHSMVPKPSTTVFSSGSCFVWASVPPVIDRSDFASSREPDMLNWHASIEDDPEIFTVALLPEFERTGLEEIPWSPKYRPSKHRTRSHSPGQLYCADDLNIKSDKQPNKRLFSHTKSICTPTFVSISTLIPFPHYYESPDPACQLPAGIERIPAFRIARALSPLDPLTMPFARTAWLVPLRGIPPIEGSSPAQLYDMLPSDDFTQAGTHPRVILWTSAAVTQFWTFLLRQRKMNNFGPISIAYMFSASPSEHGQRKIGDAKGDSEDAPDPRQREIRKAKQKENLNVGEGKRELAPRATLWEYIKIYHDSKHAMKLRSLLDSFRWEDPEGERPTPESPYRYRVLKKTSLVLVDDTGQAILLA